MGACQNFGIIFSYFLFFQMKSNPNIHSSVRHSKSTVSTASNIQNSLDAFHERTISNPVITDIRNSMINLQNEFKEKTEEKLPSNRVFQ